MKPPSREHLKVIRQEEERAELKFQLQCIQSGTWPNLEIKYFHGRGRGLVATEPFAKGSVVCHYQGTLYKGQAARDVVKRLYADFMSHYLYEIPNYKGQYYAIDASGEDNSQGRLINHACHGNLKPKQSIIDGNFYILFHAARDIERGEELLYDYGQRAPKKSDRYPWLNSCTDTCQKCSKVSFILNQFDFLHALCIYFVTYCTV